MASITPEQLTALQLAHDAVRARALRLVCPCCEADRTEMEAKHGYSCRRCHADIYLDKPPAFLLTALNTLTAAIEALKEGK